MTKYWLKCGFKKNGDLVCIRTLSNAKPSETFFYSEGSRNIAVENPRVVRLTKELFKTLLNGVEKNNLQN